MIQPEKPNGYYSKSEYGYEETLKKVAEYLEWCKVDGQEMLGDNGNCRIMVKAKVPTLSGLGQWLGVTSATVKNWANKHPELEEMLEMLEDMRHDKLVNGGLGGQYNATIAKLILTKHGYSEKVEQTLNGNENLIKSIDAVFSRAFNQTPADSRED